MCTFAVDSGLLPCSATVTHAAGNTGVQTSVRLHLQFWMYTRSDGNSMPDVLSDRHAVFHSGCLASRSRQRSRLAFSPATLLPWMGSLLMGNKMVLELLQTMPSPVFG